MSLRRVVCVRVCVCFDVTTNRNVVKEDDGHTGGTRFLPLSFFFRGVFFFSFVSLR